jgi:hypothetical protein
LPLAGPDWEETFHRLEWASFESNSTIISANFALEHASFVPGGGTFELEFRGTAGVVINGDPDLGVS